MGWMNWEITGITYDKETARELYKQGWEPMSMTSDKKGILTLWLKRSNEKKWETR